MYHRLLDRWDERRAQRGEAVKEVVPFECGAALAFPDLAESAGIAAFLERAEAAAADHAFFDPPDNEHLQVVREGEWIRFPSAMQTETEENNVVVAKITEGGAPDQALVIFHHWNASAQQSQIAGFFAKCGITVVEMALPYHFDRTRPGSTHADYMLGANIGRTLRSVRQAVWDGRMLIGWLKSQGFGEVAVLGMSLGSWVAGLIAAHDKSVTKASLFLTAGSLADMVWTGRATRAIRESLDGSIDRSQLQQAWAPIDQTNHAAKLARQDLELQIILARRDKVVLPEVSQPFLDKLAHVGAKPDIVRLNCGHYSLALPPYILFAGMRLKRLLAG
ncbi:RcgR family putative quorum lactone hydrolase [Cognatiyoonia sp. IB215182]|uniref:RcgR family putative quorum lactone hydrolase n=1 Tax=Cognatiyoonia sp. IB215182 TaxID=3097353 RepID=UPI002A180923|nr:dienelactone hydrolase-related enzyme [Cognatiyoonia sp. IB215182]MDX8352567.1 dienelactone hydrolase-related enzyme [Cognatiyoonia sp. IB215182]